LLCQWSCPASFLLEQNILLTQFNLQTLLDGHTPLFFDVHYSQVNGFLSRHIISKLHFGFSILSDTPVEVFDGIGGVNDFPDLQWKVKVIGKIIPVITP